MELKHKAETLQPQPGAGMGGGTGADADASVGVKASYEHEDSQGAYNSSTAKVSNIKARGNFSSTTTDKTSMEGTNGDVAGNADLPPGPPHSPAARNTQSSNRRSNKLGKAPWRER